MIKLERPFTLNKDTAGRTILAAKNPNVTKDSVPEWKTSGALLHHFSLVTWLLTIIRNILLNSTEQLCNVYEITLGETCCKTSGTVFLNNFPEIVVTITPVWVLNGLWSNFLLWYKYSAEHFSFTSAFYLVVEKNTLDMTAYFFISSLWIYSIINFALGCYFQPGKIFFDSTVTHFNRYWFIWCPKPTMIIPQNW